MYLIDDNRLQQNVRQAEQRHSGQHAHQQRTQEQEVSALGENRSGAERYKYDAGGHHSADNHLRINMYHMRQQRSQRVSGQEAEREQSAQSHEEMLRVIGGVGDAQHKDQSAQSAEQTGRVDLAHMDESADSGACSCGAQTGIDIDQVLAHFRFTEEVSCF